MCSAASVREQIDVLKRLRASPGVFALLEQPAESELQLQKRLRREFPGDVVRAALTLHELRRKATGKFERAGQMWFDATGLEQSTAEAVARHKARRFEGRVADFCCGIGGDSLALAEHCDVVSVDRSFADCLLTKWNADVYGVADRVQPVCADVASGLLTSRLVHIDPDRRSAGRSGNRSIRVEDCRPGPAYLHRLLSEFRGGAIKLSPASNFGTHFDPAMTGEETEIELISLHGECKEATVWFGELAAAGTWRATVLPQGETLTGDPLESLAERGPLGRFLLDPDPAVVRAGLLDVLAERLGLQRLDEEEEYLTCDRRVESPLASAFEVLAELPNNDREIRRWFRRSDFGQVEIKCRHIPVQAETIRRKLPLPGTQPGVLIFARIGGRSRAVAARRLHVGS